MRLTYFGHSAWGIEVAGKRLVIDPYTPTPEGTERLRRYAAEAETILATHGAPDHFGATLDLLHANPGLRLVSEPATARFVRGQGIGRERVQAMVWNQAREIGSFRVRAVETHHLSAFAAGENAFITGLPLAFVVSSAAEPEVTLLHLGDTSIFSDLQLIAQYYEPLVALVGIGAPPGFAGEMSPSEGAQAALWLGVRVAIPMHYGDPEQAKAFCDAVAHLPRRIRTWQPVVGSSAVVGRTTTFELE